MYRLGAHVAAPTFVGTRPKNGPGVPSSIFGTHLGEKERPGGQFVCLSPTEGGTSLRN